MSLTRQQIETHLSSAYRHLYDLVWLRTCPLADEVPHRTGGPSPREKAWELHYLLLSIVDELAEGGQAQPNSHEWRQHQLMKLRFVDGLDIEVAATELGVSRREFFREQKRAIASATLVLQERLAQWSVEQDGVTGDTEQPRQPRSSLLHSEARQAMSTDYTSNLAEVVHGVVDVLSSVLKDHQVVTDIEFPPELADVNIEPNLLRQLILACLGYLSEHGNHTTIVIRVHADAGASRLALLTQPESNLDVLSAKEISEIKTVLTELSALCGCQLDMVEHCSRIIGMQIVLATNEKPTVLVIDDNRDMIELLQRYLCSKYSVVSTQRSPEALTLVSRLQPYAVTLDLMMPELDGWDILQKLTNQPETCHIPVLVCSVLKAHDLALAMGASAFAEKPVSEGTILSLLHDLSA